MAWIYYTRQNKSIITFNEVLENFCLLMTVLSLLDLMKNDRPLLLSLQQRRPNNHHKEDRSPELRPSATFRHLSESWWNGPASSRRQI